MQKTEVIGWKLDHFGNILTENFTLATLIQNEVTITENVSKNHN